MHKVEEVRHTEALQPFFGELNQSLCPITNQVQDAGAQRLQPLVHQRFPRGVGAIVRYLFLHNIPGGHILEDQHHLFQKGFVYRPNNLSDLPMGCPILLPRLSDLKQHAFQGLHHPA